jgi:uncharacterized membrane protein YgdD (TMEM256/DUF423 family)
MVASSSNCISTAWNMSRYKIWLVTGAVLGCLAVVFGAFGAHGLESALKQPAILQELGEQQIAAKLANWETAARYQMYHALALLGVGFLTARRCTWAVNLAGVTFTLGVLIFSGCLYGLVLSGQRWLGAVVPIGGTLLIVGWVCLLVAAFQHTEPVSAGAGHVE